MFAFGLFKKVMIADTLSVWVKLVFENPTHLTFLEAWAGALSYTLQLYFDFSGYSDMAIGLGLMLNITLPINFNSPYKATSIIDFWKRWHITLSSFLKNYLYIPLGGNRHGQVQKNYNLMLTMLLGGLWHGAGWTFVIWGGLHGVYLIINHIWRSFGVRLPAIIAWLTTFSSVVCAWVFFRAQSVSDALCILRAMANLKGLVFPEYFHVPNVLEIGVTYGKLPTLTGGKKEVLLILFLVIVVTYSPNSQQLALKLQPKLWLAVGIATLMIISLLHLNQVSEFLYFQF